MANEVTIEHLRAGTVSREDNLKIARLHLASFPAKGRTVESYAEKLEAAWGLNATQREKDGLTHVIRDGEAIIAKAVSFGRVVGTQAGDLTVLALANVATADSHRGQGLGRAVVTAAFERVRVGGYPVCLFQAAERVREFYERLGACVVSNRIIDSSHGGEPAFEEEHAMRYPADVAWPEGEIDLRGPGW